ncbi:MAG: hypothetical protein KatS3mg036_0132 [Ignavibacterium sp.]|nr:MAG: hypothetical protein KatS3mg036_0132 [Ignavibacterium sp.]
MARLNKRSISELLTSAQTVIFNSLADPEILGYVSKYGYTKEKLEEGKQLYEAAVEAKNNQTKAAGAQYQATEVLKKIEKIAREAYLDLAKVARAVFKDDKSRLAQLGITGKMPLKTADFLNVSMNAFNNALTIPEILDSLTHFGYDEAKLNSEKQKIIDFEQANLRQEAAKGAAQQATKDQEAALNALDKWLSQYVSIVKVALKDNKQLMEKLGIRVYSGKTKAQREGVKKAQATKANKKGQ